MELTVTQYSTYLRLLYTGSEELIRGNRQPAAKRRMAGVLGMCGLDWSTWRSFGLVRLGSSPGHMLLLIGMRHG